MADRLKKDVGVASTNRGSNADLRSAAAPPEETFPPERTVTVLAISPNEDDHLFLANIFSHTNWQLRAAHTWRDALAMLAR